MLGDTHGGLSFGCRDACRLDLLLSPSFLFHGDESDPSSVVSSDPGEANGERTHSISTSTSFGNLATSTQLLAGLLPPKYSAYSVLNAAKSLIDLRKTVDLSTFEGDEEDAVRTA